MDTLHPTFVFEKINDSLPNIFKCIKDWYELQKTFKVKMIQLLFLLYWQKP
jgi:hypothetical protein